jgi:hypothetical protein
MSLVADRANEMELLHVILGLAAIILGGGTSGTPDFRDYPADAMATTPFAQPQLKTHVAKRFRSEIRREAAHGPNFNGHYRLAMWGCGTSCIYWSVIDLTKGSVWVSAMNTCALARIDQNGEPQWFDAGINSRLVRLYDCASPEAGCSRESVLLRRSYVWDGRAPKRVASDCMPAD